MKKSLSRGSLIAALAVCAAGCKNGQQHNAAGEATAKSSAPAAVEGAPRPAPPAALPAPDFTISARDIYAEFRPQIEAGTADAVKAKYTGKTVRISGEVSDNVDMGDGTWELQLKADDNTGHAYAHPSPAAVGAIKALKAADKVTLQCVSAGWEIGPQLNDCVLVP